MDPNVSDQNLALSSAEKEPGGWPGLHSLYIFVAAGLIDTSDFPSSGEAVTVASSRVEVDPLADPNAVKARIKAFEGLEEALKRVDQESRKEIREWTRSTAKDKTSLVKAVQPLYLAR